MFKTIGIYFGNIDSQISEDRITNLIKFLSNKVEKVCSFNSKNISVANINEVDKNYFAENVDLIVVFGGDGTLLSASRDFYKFDIPILGVNFGAVGFLTDIKISDFEKSINEILLGKYSVEERILVSANCGNLSISGLNEVVIHSGSFAQLMRYRLEIDGMSAYEQRSDGLIISTPTGSTAYALSAGGSIVHPKLDVWNIVPMLSQSLSSRPLIVPAEQNLSLQIISGPLDNARICADGGKEYRVPYSEIIEISKSSKSLKLIHPENINFYEACIEKLGWSLDITKSR